MRVRPWAGRLCLAAVCCALAGSAAQAQNGPVYWVAPNGSDTAGDGSSSSPWATVSAAVAKAPDTGGTIIVRDGLYEARASIARKFKAPLIVRAEHPYRARLRSNGTVALSIVGAANVVVTGFDVAKAVYPNSPLAAQIARSESIALIDNLIHDSMNNDVLKVNEGSRQILILGNIFYNQEGAAGQHIDFNGTVDVTVRENIFLNDPNPAGADLAPTHGFIVAKNSDQLPESRRTHIAGNVFLNFHGSTGSNFVLFGEDGLTVHETQEALVENNLMIGNSAVRMRSPLGVKGCRDIVFRNNTVTGDLPSSAFGMRLNREAANQRNRNIGFYNNIWSDPGGTMNNFSDGPPQDSIGTVLERNLYWNGGQALPGGENLTPAADPQAVLRNPLLPSPVGLTVPRWNGETFASGSQTIRQEFERLVRLYGTPPAPPRRPGRLPGAMQVRVIGGASLEHAPSVDVLGRPRGLNPDFGAVQEGAPDLPFRLVLLREEMAGGGATTMNQVILRAPAPAGGTKVTLTSSHPEIARAPSTVLVEPGAMIAPFSMTTSAVDEPTRVMLSASGPDGESGAAIVVTPVGVRSVNLGTESVTASAEVSRNSVLYDGLAGAEGVVVSLVSSHPELVQAPEHVTILPGTSYSEPFALITRFTQQPATVTITATAGRSSASSELTLTPPVFRLFIRDQISGEAIIRGSSITLHMPAPAGGAVVELRNPRPDLLDLPATVLVPEGETSVGFEFPTKVVDADTNLVITATWADRTTSVPLRIGPLKPYSLTIPPTAPGGAPVSLTLMMGSLGASAFEVQLSAPEGAPISLPKSVLVPAQTWYVRVPVETRTVAVRTPVRITATYRGHSISGEMTVTPPELGSLKASPASVLPGRTVTATVALNGAAPEGGLKVDLSSSSAVLAPPSSITIQGGATSAAVDLVAAQVWARTTVRLTAAFGGTSRSAEVTVAPTEATRFSMSASVAGGSNGAMGSRVLLNAPAPDGTRVRLGSSHPAVASVPAEIEVPAGKDFATFDVTTFPVREPVVVRITATLNLAAIAAELTVTPPAVNLITLSPAEIQGGQGSASSVAYLSAPAFEEGLRIAFVSSNPDVVPHPADVTVPAAARYVRWAYATKAVTAETLITITATGGGRSVAAVLKVKP
ncbi:MAG TPA: right-handed parallel beta-helix repeat-containing protein [Bryobacteraceae bacterium]|nr:right-handed parallel beta-helix repeat-containing protein [Bryobacteraceae bacterium]